MTASNTPRLVFAAVAVAAVALIAILLGSGGDDNYRVRLVLDDAHGLREGTSVRVGDIDAGKVHKVALGAGDKVFVDVDLDQGEGPVGRDAKVAISSLNLLGQRFLSLDKGNVDQPAPSGTTLGDDRVSVSTDLDQVLNTLDTSTRTRLGILLNEAGIALTGRKDDVQLLLRELPHTLPEITTLLERITADNRSLAKVVDDGDRFIGGLNAKRDDLVELFDSAHETAKTFATKRAQIDATLRAAPGMLRTTQALLGDLRATSAPLGPAARNLVRTAAPLENTLAALKPFIKAADPVLDEASDASPALTRLAAGATPVLRAAAATAGKLDRFATSAKPATATLNDSVSNLIAILDNWSRALQYRDSLSHTFRGEPSVTSNTVESFVERLMNQQSARRRKKAPAPAPVAKTAPTPAPARTPEAPAAVKPLLSRLPDVPKVLGDAKSTVSKTVTTVQDALLGRRAPESGGEKGGSSSSGSETLLDFLLKP